MGRNRERVCASPPRKARLLSSTDTHIEEMEGESGATMPLFEVRWLHFNDGVAFELVNAVIARVAAGWQPFATLQHPSGGWSLLLRRQAAP